MSKEEEPSPTIGIGVGGEMSLYDKYRTPHPVITDSTEITITPRSLASELMCPICLDMLNSTMTTKECLHRFCLNCITTALRSGNKECPTCRKKLVSKRSLRPDPNFDALIAKIYPNRDEYEEMQQRAFQRLSKHTNPEAFRKSVEECLKHQAQLRRKQKINPGDFEYKKRVRRPKPTLPTEEEGVSSLENAGVPTADEGEMERESSMEPSASEASESTGAAVYQQEIELILRPHPDLEKDAHNIPAAVRQTRYLKTTGNATVDHISKYVAMRVRLDQEEANRIEASLGAETYGPLEEHSPPEQVNKAPLGESNNHPFQNGTAVPEAVSNGVPSPDSTHYHIFVNPGIGSNKQYTPLDGSWTLAEVRNQYWKVKKPLELQFRVDGSEIDRHLKKLAH